MGRRSFEVGDRRFFLRGHPAMKLDFSQRSAFEAVLQFLMALVLASLMA